MTLEEFLREVQTEVRQTIGEQLASHDEEYPYTELVFAEVVMEHMSEVGMTFDPTICHYSARIGNANLRLSGYALSDDAEQMDLFVSLYAGTNEIENISDRETKTAAEQCLRFLARCAEGTLASRIDESSDAFVFAKIIHECYAALDQIRIYVLSDRRAKSKNFKAREIGGKVIKLEVMDIERLHRHWSEGKPRDEIELNFLDICGEPLPCVYVPGNTDEYAYALTAFPGEALRFVYDKYGDRLLEANVRSFLNAVGKVNKGIRDTLRDSPSRFMAYNNGIVVIADELRMNKTEIGAPGISWMKGMQIVNGGQTTASIYFTKKKSPDIDLSKVWVFSKIIILHPTDKLEEEELVSSISRFANSQNVVRQADLSANKPFHVEMEKFSISVYCPDGIGRWFYERARGSYNVLLSREGNTPARRKKIKTAIPTSRKITKTDLAKFINAWDQKPHTVSKGAQKNFVELMNEIDDQDGLYLGKAIDASTYKQLIAKAIFFKAAHKICRRTFQAFQANVAAYLVAIASRKIGNTIDLDKIWQRQELSDELKDQLTTWAREVNDVLHSTSGGRMISEWAKKKECWDIVSMQSYSKPSSAIPEIRVY